MTTAPPVGRVSGVNSVYDTLRPTILQRLIDSRATFDPSLARSDEASAREQLDAVLAHFGNFIATGDLGLHRAFLHTFMAIRAAEAQLPGSVLAMLVAIGDMAVQVAQDGVDGAAPVAPNPELAVMLTRVTASTARAVNDLIAEELERRTAQLGELQTNQHAALEPA